VGWSRSAFPRSRWRCRRGAGCLEIAHAAFGRGGNPRPYPAPARPAYARPGVAQWAVAGGPTRARGLSLWGARKAGSIYYRKGAFRIVLGRFGRMLGSAKTAIFIGFFVFSGIGRKPPYGLSRPARSAAPAPLRVAVSIATLWPTSFLKTGTAGPCF